MPLLLTLLLAAAHPTKVAVTEIEAGVGVEPKVAHLVTAMVTSELRQNPALVVTSQDDIQNLLGFEKQKQMLACADVSCLAEVGGALGVDQMVSGSLSALGKSYVLLLRAIDVHHAHVLRDVERRLRNANPDALLDVIPKAVTALYPREGAPAPVASVSEITVPKPSSAPYWLAGAGAAGLAAGLGLFLQVRAGVGVSPNYYAENPWAGARANLRGDVGEGIAIAGGVALISGLAWAALRPAEERP